MDIYTHIGRGIDNRDGLASRIEERTADALAHVARRLTRVDVHLQDQSAGRPTGDDIRCTLEARPAGADPMTVRADAATADEAVGDAAASMQALLRTAFGRIDDRERQRTSIGDVPPELRP